jgi:hypothetical protein
MKKPSLNLSIFRYFTVCILISVVCSPALALWIAKPLKELVANSELIVIGTVKSSHSYLDGYFSPNNTAVELDDIPSRMFTNIEIEINEVLKGKYEQKQISVSQFGGSINGAAEMDTGSYYLDIDDLVLMFLKWNEPNKKWFSVSHSASVFHIDKNDNSERLIAMEGIHVVPTHEEQKRTSTGIVLDVEFLVDVRKEIAHEN